METREYQVYKYDELSDEAKEKAIQEHYNINVADEWWDGVYMDADNIGLKITEFDIGRGSYCGGEFTEGAEYTADKITTEHGEKCETYMDAVSYLASRSDLVAEYSDGVVTDTVAEDNEYDFDKDCDELDSEFLKIILEDYRIMLSKEYDWLTSDEQIAETLRANDYELTVGGKID